MAMRISGVMPTLAVTDIARARDFYGGKLGLKEVGSFLPDESDCLYRVGDQGYLYLFQRAQPSGSTATSCAFQVQDVEETVKALRGRGVRFEEYDLPELDLKTIDGVATQGAVKSAFFTDPFGNIIAIDNGLAVMADRLRERQRDSPDAGLHA
jgi:catechol 2,3-dioxygenase-like lactoylglutathione lyase family enzyme